MQEPDSSDRRDRVVAWAILAVQLILLAAVFLLPRGSTWSVPAWVSAGAAVLATVGLVVVVVGLVQLGRSVTPLPIPVTGGKLRTTGLYRWVRHPVYSGLMALAVGSAIPSGSVAVAVAAVALVAWLRFKAGWEEPRLARRYSGYAAYAARTPRFIPSRGSPP